MIKKKTAVYKNLNNNINMGRPAANERSAFGQNYNTLPDKMRTNKTVQFQARTDALRKQYELNHPLVHSAPTSKQVNKMIRAAHQTNLPKVANEYSKHGRAWFS
jgi:hypothetical protein